MYFLHASTIIPIYSAHNSSFGTLLIRYSINSSTKLHPNIHTPWMIHQFSPSAWSTRHLNSSAYTSLLPYRMRMVRIWRLHNGEYTACYRIMGWSWYRSSMDISDTTVEVVCGCQSRLFGSFSYSLYLGTHGYGLWPHRPSRYVYGGASKTSKVKLAATFLSSIA